MQLLHPALVRLLHWLLAATVFLLWGTGVASLLGYGEMRWLHRVHLVSGIALLLIYLGQAAFYCYSRRWPEVVFGRSDWQKLSSFWRYTFFITETHPDYGRYNPGQKLLFALWSLAIIWAGISGLLLADVAPAGLGIQWLGGLPLLRLGHAALVVVFGTTVLLHIYLALTESPEHLQAMFTGWRK